MTDPSDVTRDVSTDEASPSDEDHAARGGSTADAKPATSTAKPAIRTAKPATSTAKPAIDISRLHRTYWWKETIIIVAFYVLYSYTRNRFGSNRLAEGGIPRHAFHNAMRIVRLEQFLGTFHERAFQHAFLGHETFIQFWNTFYGTAHFVVTIVVFALLYKFRPGVFPQWRNTLAFTTALAIAGFALFPLMPPRLLDEPCADFGGACLASDTRPAGGFGFVDTLSAYGGPWSFDSDTMVHVSNQFAAMPSMHIGWSTWCAIGMWPLLRRRWQRVVVFMYPTMTFFCIIVTANHFWLDAVGGLVTLAVGSMLGWRLHRWNQNRLDRHWADAYRSEQPSTVAGDPVASVNAG